MSNVANSEYCPVAGETRYRKYFRVNGKRIRFIILSNYMPEKYYWRTEEGATPLMIEEAKVR
jgi:hypothetical protein